MMLAFIRPAFAVNDPVAYWKLDGDALDYSSGGSNDGTPQGGPVYVTNGGKHGSAVVIDGVDDQLLMPVGALKPSPSLSYGGWFRPEDAGNDATRPVGWDGGIANAYALGIDQA